MKKIFAALLAVALSVICQFAFAAPAVVSGLTGSAQAIPIAGSTRTLKNGDSVNEGDKVTTGDKSSLVLTFEDGQIVALGAKSKMAVTTYKYNEKEPAKSSVLFSLVTGGMRAITGLIGKASPERVAYKAGNATMGIRGTDITFATDGGNKVVMQVTTGQVSFYTVSVDPDGLEERSRPYTVVTNNGILSADGKFTTGTIDQINAKIANNPSFTAVFKSLTTANVKAAVDAAQKAVTKAAEDKVKADAKVLKAKEDADKAKSDAEIAAAKKAAADARDALNAAELAAAEAKAALALAEAAKAATTAGAPINTGTGAGSGGAGGSGGGGVFKEPASKS